ncbi:MAG: FAD-dependent monooxygenase [Chloroflexota bacterium]
MNDHDKQYDVIIVGCGPVGAMLANFVRRYGWKVAIFDREKEIFFAPRAYGLDDETMRTMQTLGLARRFQEENHVYQGKMLFCDGDYNILTKFDTDSVGEDLLIGPTGHYYLNFFDQRAMEGLLREEFELEDGADAFLGYEVSSVQDSGSQVTVQAQNLETQENLTFTAKYVVGCDGGRSLVGKTIGGEAIDWNYREQYLVIDAIVEDEAYHRTQFPDGGMFVLDSKRPGVIAKGVHGLVRFDFFRPPELINSASTDDADYAEEARELITERGFDADKCALLRHSPYIFHARTPKLWRKGRLLVAGDAAHLTPPWAGQGLNMGVRDSANIAFKLDLVMAGKAHESILDTYQQERLPVSLDTIQGAVDMGKLMQRKSALTLALRNLVFALTRNSRFVIRQFWKAWLRKPQYKAGLIGKHKLAGALMPQPRLIGAQGESQLMDEFIGLRFALITRQEANGPAVDRFQKQLDGVILTVGKDVHDPEKELTTWFDKVKVDAVMVRPDRYIFDAGKDGEALCGALFESLEMDHSINASTNSMPRH